MKNKNLNVPNLITVVRIIGTAALLFIRPLSIPFFVIYTIAGITDVLDGVIARATNTMTVFGSKLDSAADLMFYAVMLLKIFPVLWDMLPRQIWLFVALIILIRIFAYLTAAIKYKQFASRHSYLNKLTGLSLFCVPYILTSSFAPVFCWTVCVIAAIASVFDAFTYILKKN